MNVGFNPVLLHAESYTLLAACWNNVLKLDVGVSAWLITSVVVVTFTFTQ